MLQNANIGNCKMRSLILASTSKPRKMLLERLKIPFMCVAPQTDETPQANETPDKLVQRLAQEKASSIANDYPNSLIIGADQVGFLENTILGKPLTQENAIHQLTLLSGKAVKFFIGLCLLDTQSNTSQIHLETFTVFFRTLTRTMIENYLRKEQALNCAGSFTVEGLGIALVDKLQGEDYTALIGLPLIQLSRMLKINDLHPI